MAWIKNPKAIGSGYCGKVFKINLTGSWCALKVCYNKDAINDMYYEWKALKFLQEHNGNLE